MHENSIILFQAYLRCEKKMTKSIFRTSRKHWTGNILELMPKKKAIEVSTVLILIRRSPIRAFQQFYDAPNSIRHFLHIWPEDSILQVNATSRKKFVKGTSQD